MLGSLDMVMLMKKLWMRLSYLQMRSFCLQFAFFAYGVETVSKKDQTQSTDGRNRK